MDISSSLELLLRVNRLVGYVCTVCYKAVIRLACAVCYSLDVYIYIVLTTAAATGVNIEDE